MFTSVYVAKSVSFPAESFEDFWPVLNVDGFGLLSGVVLVRQKYLIVYCLLSGKMRQNALGKIIKTAESCCSHFDFLLL